MDFFRSRNAANPRPIQEGNPREVVEKLDVALTAIFSENGKRTVTYYMNNKFGLTLEQATLDPSKLEKALTSMLGEIGWMVVKRAILEEFYNEKIGVEQTAWIERASLGEAFGFLRGLGLGRMLRP